MIIFSSILFIWWLIGAATLLLIVKRYPSFIWLRQDTPEYINLQHLAWGVVFAIFGPILALVFVGQFIEKNHKKIEVFVEKLKNIKIFRLK